MSSNIFLTKWSEISGDRFDPLMVLYKKTTQAFRYETVSFKDLLLSNPMYGANEAGVERTDENEPRYIRITDIDEFGNLKDGLGVTAQVIEEKYFLNENDLLFARSGATVGKAYIHRQRPYECFFAGYMIRFVVDSDKIDPYYVFLYTQLDIYKKWVSSIQRAAGQPNINAEEYKSLPIPIPPKEIQKEIVNKIQDAYKQKQQKEDEAKKLLNSIDEYLLQELGINLPKIDESDISKRVFLRKWSEISGNRFDPDYYSPKYFEKINILKKSSCKIISLKDIAIIFQGVGKSETNNPKYTLLKVKNILKDSTIDFEDVEFVSSVPKNKILSKYDIISPFIGEAIKQFKFALFDGEEDKYAVDNNTGVIRINSKKINNCFVCEVLNSGFVRWQIEQLIGGGGVPFIGSSGAKLIKIPRPRIKQQNKIAKHIESIREQAKSLKQQAIDDFEKAKKEVEAILLGETDEF
ncbi:restriction endonuclease subunit S [Aliarcobacter butzleri]|uniref:Restriction endonuclease subunit S n=1 Tax=Aliarcobacter butzleri TaxID=28197 RepID=A0AAW7PST6_9BACT|nr:restriction endonuclease subunit S [Aliarcobacter butzleri]MDN5063954.1 restriction endonuclease subunit S [Aliarcobacter butzleri]MDN5065188.1 restriction endonuclease subunit S [Aliarcobacter butzleri]